MSQINQIQMSYAPVEDRILLRINTTGGAGFQFWMTRRYVKLLWPVLLQMLSRDQHVTVQKNEEARKEVLKFQHQEAAQKMDYSQPYEEKPTEQPLGSDPLLLSRIQAKKRDDGVQVLNVSPEEGQGIELALTQTLLHSICKLLQDTVAKTDWDIDLSRELSVKVDASVPENVVLN